MSETGDYGQIPITVDAESAGFAQADEVLATVVKCFADAKGIRVAVVYSGKRRLMPSDGSETLRALGISELSIARRSRWCGSPVTIDIDD